MQPANTATAVKSILRSSYSKVFPRSLAAGCFYCQRLQRHANYSSVTATATAFPDIAGSSSQSWMPSNQNSAPSHQERTDSRTTVLVQDLDVDVIPADIMRHVSRVMGNSDTNVRDGEMRLRLGLFLSVLFRQKMLTVESLPVVPLLRGRMQPSGRALVDFAQPEDARQFITKLRAFKGKLASQGKPMKAQLVTPTMPPIPYSLQERIPLALAPDTKSQIVPLRRNDHSAVEGTINLRETLHWSGRAVAISNVPLRLPQQVVIDALLAEDFQPQLAPTSAVIDPRGNDGRRFRQTGQLDDIVELTESVFTQLAHCRSKKKLIRWSFCLQHHLIETD